MDAALQNIVLERLCSALTGIVIDILKYCKMDPEAQEQIIRNITNIKGIIEMTAPRTSGKNDDVVKILGKGSGTKESIQRPGKRKQGDVTKVQTSQSKRGKNDHTVRLNLFNPPISPQIDGVNLVPEDPASIQIAQQHAQIVEKIAINEDFELVAIAPERKVFISNFPIQTTASDIQSYVRKKLPTTSLSGVNISKIDSKSNRPTFSSFTINTGENIDLFNQLVDPKLWPMHSVVHEFDANRRRPNFHQGRRKHRRT